MIFAHFAHFAHATLDVPLMCLSPLRIAASRWNGSNIASGGELGYGWFLAKMCMKEAKEAKKFADLIIC